MNEDRRIKEPEYFDGMKHFVHPRLGARSNRRIPSGNKWQESDDSNVEKS